MCDGFLFMIHILRGTKSLIFNTKWVAEKVNSANGRLQLCTFMLGSCANYGRIILWITEGDAYPAHLHMTSNMLRRSTMRVLFRGRRSIWWFLVCGTCRSGLCNWHYISYGCYLWELFGVGKQRCICDEAQLQEVLCVAGTDRISWPCCFVEIGYGVE